MVMTMSPSETTRRPGPGDAAPAFTSPATTGGTFGLADFKGKSTLILAFFPKAFTSG